MNGTDLWNHRKLKVLRDTFQKADDAWSLFSRLTRLPFHVILVQRFSLRFFFIIHTLLNLWRVNKNENHPDLCNSVQWATQKVWLCYDLNAPPRCIEIIINEPKCLTSLINP